MSSTIIVGIDEAGRGPLAGPVVAAAVYLPTPLQPHERGGWVNDRGDRIFDSKQLEPHQREAAYEWITATCPHGIAAMSAMDIDTIGILEATNNAMQHAVRMLSATVTPTYLVVDGRDAFWFDYPHSSLIGGDALEPAIAAASILAKVTRDRLMTEHAATFPQYGFERHKGYGAPEHINAIKTHGPCPLHRTSYLTRIILPEQSAPTAATAQRPQ